MGAQLSCSHSIADSNTEQRRTAIHDKHERAWATYQHAIISFCSNQESFAASNAEQLKVTRLIGGSDFDWLEERQVLPYISKYVWHLQGKTIEVSQKYDDFRDFHRKATAKLQAENDHLRRKRAEMDGREWELQESCAHMRTLLEAEIASSKALQDRNDVLEQRLHALLTFLQQRRSNSEIGDIPNTYAHWHEREADHEIEDLDRQTQVDDLAERGDGLSTPLDESGFTSTSEQSDDFAETERDDTSPRQKIEGLEFEEVAHENRKDNIFEVSY
jgi:hypothetical protein